MKSKITKRIVGVVFIMAFVYFSAYFIQNIFLEKSLNKYIYSYDTSNLVKGEVVRCNLNIFAPEIAFIDETRNRYDNRQQFSIDFHFVDNILDIKNNDWTEKYTGSTDIKNTTFSELLSMVKDDCLQFQEDYNNPDSNGIDWGYRKATTYNEDSSQAPTFDNSEIKVINVENDPAMKEEIEKMLEEEFGTKY